MNRFPSIDADQLATFVRVAREGSFSSAARSLNVGQPAVSARLKALESTLGGALLTRARPTRLTALGERFLPYARRTLDLLAEGVDAAQNEREGRLGRVTLATLGSLGSGLIGPSLDRFLAAHPEAECMVRSGDHERVMQLLWDGVVELGLIAWPCADSFAQDLVVLAKFSEPVILVASPKHPLAHAKKKVSESDLIAQLTPVLALRWWQTMHPEVARIAAQCGARVDVPMEVAQHLVTAARAVGFFVKTLVAQDLARGTLVELKTRGIASLSRESALVRRADARPLSPLSRSLVSVIQAEAKRVGLTVSAR